MIDNVSKGPQCIEWWPQKPLREQQRQRIMRAAEAAFAAGGLGSTSVAALAKAGGVAVPVLHSHFGTKRKLFEEVVNYNAESRLAGLRDRFLEIPKMPPIQCVESMAEATVLACVDPIGNASVMGRALVEIPDFASDVYRAEVGATEALWNAEIGRRFEGSPVRTRLTVHLVPYAAHTCMAFGFWLAALRHNPATAQGHARQYADGIVHVAQAVLEAQETSFQAVS